MMFQDVPTILEKFIQPRVIDQSMLINVIIDQGPKKEAGRLYIEDGIKLDEIKEIRLEFLNILRIDYLWVMQNLVELKLSNNIIEKIENLEMLIHLKELDLSFNHIKILENLNNLKKLEILLLCNNEISVVENIDNLRELTILNIGNNVISDWEHILYLRKFKKLRSLNVSGNPCAEENGYLKYLIAFIPQLIYYQYKMISNEERSVAMEEHKELTLLQDRDAKEEEVQNAKEEYEKKVVFFTTAFVEYLDDDSLFEKLFENDEEGKALSLVNEDTQNAFEEYRKSFSTVCKELCNFGLTEHNRRLDEIDAYNNAVKKGKEVAENQGRSITSEILQRKLQTLTNMRQLLNKITGDVDNEIVEDIAQKTKHLSEEFNDLVTNAWTKLMSNEVLLHEQMEDINEVFKTNMTDMVDSFLVIAQGYFSQLRNCEAEYSDTINGIVLYYLSGFGDESKIPKELLNVCGDKDILTNNLATSHDKHLQIIDNREESLLSRLRHWVEEYTEQLIQDEIERNHTQILEISHFSDYQIDEVNSLQLQQHMNLATADPEIILSLET